MSGDELHDAGATLSADTPKPRIVPRFTEPNRTGSSRGRFTNRGEAECPFMKTAL